MATVDQANNMYVIQAFEPASYTATGTSTTIDTSGFEAVTFILTLGAYTDGEFAFYFEDSSDDMTYNPVFVATSINEGAQVIPLVTPVPPAPQTLFPYSTATTDYTITSMTAHNFTHNATAMTGSVASWWVGYTGPNRYLKMQMNVAGSPSTGMALSGDWVLEWPHTAPTRLIPPNQVG